MQENNNKTSVYELKNRIVEAFFNLKPGDVISYDQIANLIGMECAPNTPGQGYSYLREAKLTASRQPGGVDLKTISHYGYERVMSEDESIAAIRTRGEQKQIPSRVVGLMLLATRGKNVRAQYEAEDTKESRAAVLKAFGTLYGDDALVIFLHDICGMTYSEIGPTLGITGDAAAEIGTRALRSLRHPANLQHFEPFVRAKEDEPGS